MSAPSFSSFPPVFNSFPDTEAGPSSQKEKDRPPKEKRKEKGDRKDKRKVRDRDDDRPRDKNDEKRKGHEHERKSRHDRSRDGDKSSKHRKRDEPLRSEDAFRAESDSRSRIFFEDRKGDDLNVTYGSLHLGDVPRYRPVAGGYSILGLDKDWVVVYRGGKGVEIGAKGDGRRKPPQLTDKKTRALLAAGPVRRLQPSAKSLLKYDEIDGFIRVPTRKGKEKEQAYRSIEDEKDDNSDSDSTSGSEGDSSGYDSDTVPFSAREEALRNLELKLQSSPTSIQDWLLLLEHSLSETSASNKNAAVARADISVSILRRALSAHRDNLHSPLLRLKYLRAGEDLWQYEGSKMAEEWETALSETNNVDLWVEWFDWIIRKAGKNFEDASLNAAKALNNLPKDLFEDTKEVARLRIFWRVAECMKQAGYVERCNALFQAQAELSFFVPDNIRHFPLEQQLDALEEFWDSEAPRIGEASAKGWKYSLNDEGANTIPAEDKLSKPDGHDPIAVWRQFESLSDKHSILSRRATDMDEDDPFTTVLFSDIRSYLIPLQTRKGLETFRLIWLTSLGIHIPGFTASLSDMGLDDRWADSALARSKIIQRLFPSPDSRHLITADSYAGVTIGREKKYKWSFDVLKEWGYGILGTFDALTASCRGRMWEDQDSYDANQDLVRGIFQQLRMPNDGPDWDILALAFDASCCIPSKVLKLSQTLLSANSSSPELLATHARLERINNKPDKARKVYRVALSSLSEKDGHGIAQLYWDAAEFEWLQSQSDSALEVVFQAANQKGSKTGVQLLRVRRRLEELSQEAPGIPNRYRLCWVKLSILLELLTGSLEAAVQVAERYEEKESSGKQQHEAITTAKLLLVYHHTVTLRNPAPTSVLRNLIQKALEVYPSNTIILGLFLECEKGEGVWGRVRNLMSEGAVGSLQEKGVVRRIFDAWIGNWEEGRWLGEVERIRSGLEAAMNSDRTKGSPILWKIFVKFEIAAGDLKKAKAALFRALHECPLVKELYLLAFDDGLRTAFTNRELLSLADAMAERGIRMRRSLGEMLEESNELEGEQKREREEREEDGDSELEYNSRELRRLMPY